MVSLNLKSCLLYLMLQKKKKKSGNTHNNGADGIVGLQLVHVRILVVYRVVAIATRLFIAIRQEKVNSLVSMGSLLEATF